MSTVILPHRQLLDQRMIAVYLSSAQQSEHVATLIYEYSVLTVPAFRCVAGYNHFTQRSNTQMRYMVVLNFFHLEFG
jgi:hypothetical protein